MWIKSGILIFMFFTLMNLSAQVKLTLEECIRQALMANPELANRHLEKQIKQNDQLAAWGELLPQVTTEMRLGKRFGRAIDPGTNLFATRNFVESALNLEVSVPLFEGFTRMNKIGFERVNREISQWEVMEKENEIAFGVMDAFYQVLFQEQLLALAREQRRLSERYLQQVEGLVEEGLKAPVDLQEVKARLSSDVYQQTVRQNAFRIAILELKQLIWMKPEDSLQLVFSGSDEETVGEILSVKEVYEQSMHFLPQFKLMELRRKASRKALAMEKGRFAPSLRGDIGVYTGYYDTEREENGHVIALGKQLDNNLNKYFGITFSVPLLTGFRNLSGWKKARLRLQQTENTIQLQQQQLYTEIERARVSLGDAIQEIRYANEMELAEKLTLEQTEEKWKEGLVSVFELMEARNRYFNSRAEVIRTRLQYGIKRKTMNFYRGMPWYNK